SSRRRHTRWPRDWSSDVCSSDLFAWDGELLAVGLEDVNKPRLFGFFDWEAIGVYYRAMMMSIAPAAIAKGRLLDREPSLGPAWWDQLRNAISAIQAKHT